MSKMISSLYHLILSLFCTGIVANNPQYLLEQTIPYHFSNNTFLFQFKDVQFINVNSESILNTIYAYNITASTSTRLIPNSNCPNDNLYLNSQGKFYCLAPDPNNSHG